MSKRFKKRYLLLGIPILLIVLALLKPNMTEGEQISIQKIETGNLEFSISSSGQVTSDQNVNLNPQGNGPVTQVLVEEGDLVRQGQQLLSLNTTSQAVNVRNAELDLESAEIQLDELKKPVSDGELTRAKNELLRAQNDLAQRQTTYELDLKNQDRLIADLEEDVPSAYEDAFNTIASIFVDLPDSIADLESIVEAKHYESNQTDLNYYNNSLGTLESAQQKNKAESRYNLAVSTYNKALALYQATSRTDTEALPALTQSTYDAVDAVSSALKEMDIFLAMVFEDFPIDHPNYAVDEQRDLVQENIAVINPHLSSIYDDLRALDDLTESIEEAQDKLNDITIQFESDVTELELSIEEKESALKDLQDGVNDNEVRQQEIEIEKRRNNLEAAQKAYQDQFITAPFSGVITSVGVDLGQNVSSATIAFTLVSQEKLIEVNLNEIDVSQVRVGQTGTARFDSFPDELIPVELAFVSELNETESSVVEYKAHFTLGAHTLELKEGMSAEVELILDQKENVLIIPRLALIEEDGQNYVEIAENVGSKKENTLYSRSEFVITRVPVSIGLSNAENIEVLEGLEPGDWVILQASTAEAAPENPFGPPPANQGTPQ